MVLGIENELCEPRILRHFGDFEEFKGNLAPVGTANFPGFCDPQILKIKKDLPRDLGDRPIKSYLATMQTYILGISQSSL